MRVYGDDGGDYLGDQKEENGDVQRSFGELEPFNEEGSYGP